MLQLLLDTRSLWPDAKSTADLTIHASRALSLLPQPDRTACLRFVFARDAKLAIASALLKRLAISSLLRIPWADAGPVVQDRSVRGGKPMFAAAAGIEFNVSHQDGIVALAAAAAATTSIGGGGGTSTVALEIGVDVVSPRERRAHDTTTIATHGWPHFINIHSDVFSAVEVSRLKNWSSFSVSPSSSSSSSSSLTSVNADDNDDKLRAFYALWCLREAWVKMSGDALLAEWLGELEFRTFRAPPPLPDTHTQQQQRHRPPPSSGGGGGDDDEYVGENDDNDNNDITEKDLDIHFKGQKVDTATTKVRLTALEGGYMVCAAVRRAAATTPEEEEEEEEGRLEIGRWAWIGMDDVLGFAERGGGGELRVGATAAS